MRDMNRTTHGKNGVPELEAVVLPEQIAEYRARPCPDRHEVMRQNAQVFNALTVGEHKEQKDEDGFVLFVMRICANCGTSVAYPPSLEARRRLEETHAQTRQRHAEGRAL